MTEPQTEIHSAEKSLFQLTRELELLISAGLVFALLQLPDMFDAWWIRTSVHTGGASFQLTFMAYEVGKLVSYALIAAISAHFLLRGFWVAVMGLRSVYPGGMQLDKLDQGEIYRKYYEERLMSLEEIEARIDRLAASIFAFVFLFLLIVAMLTAWSAVAWVIAFAVAKIAGTDAVIMPVLVGLFAVFAVLQRFVTSVDKKSKKGPVSPRSERLATRILKPLHYLTLNFVYAPVFFTFASYSSRRKMTLLLVSFAYAMLGVFLFSFLHARGVVGFDSYIYYPSQAREHQLRAAHYDTLRNRDVPVSEPTIQSEVVEGPYLRLFVPYDAREDNDRVRALCPNVAPLRGDGVFFARTAKVPPPRMAQLNACFDRLYQIALDGRIVEKPGFVFHRHPQGQVAGRLALLPIGSLPPGRHLLTVRHTPLPRVKNDRSADEFFIPFWR